MTIEAAMLTNINFQDYGDVQDAMRRLRRTFDLRQKDTEIPFTFDKTQYVLAYTYNNGDSKFVVYNVPTRLMLRQDRDTTDITHRMRMHILRLPEVQAVMV